MKTMWFTTSRLNWPLFGHFSLMAGRQTPCSQALPGNAPSSRLRLASFVDSPIAAAGNRRQSLKNTGFQGRAWEPAKPANGDQREVSLFARYVKVAPARESDVPMIDSVIRMRALVFILFAYCILAGREGAAQTPAQARTGIPAQLAKHTAILADEPLRTVARELGPNGGSRRTLGDLQVETVLNASGIQVKLSDTSGQPLDSTQTRGVATLKVAGESKRFRFDLLPDQTGSLKSNTNLTRTMGRQVEIEIYLIGLSSRLAAQGKVRFREVITVAPSATQLAVAAITRQGVCPVSGKPLGSMGSPVPVSVGRKTVYLCCTACEAIVAKNPKKYETGKPTILVSTSTAQDAEAIAQQKVCPVMDEPLGGMGTPIKVMVGDRTIFLCCKGCIKKVEAEPMKYLAMLDTSAGSAKNVESPAELLATPVSSNTYTTERMKR